MNPVCSRQKLARCLGKANEPEACGVRIREDSYDISTIVYPIPDRQSRSTGVLEGLQYRDGDLSVARLPQKREREQDRQDVSGLF